MKFFFQVPSPSSARKSCNFGCCSKTIRWDAANRRLLLRRPALKTPNGTVRQNSRLNYYYYYGKNDNFDSNNEVANNNSNDDNNNNRKKCNFSTPDLRASEIFRAEFRSLENIVESEAELTAATENSPNRGAIPKRRITVNPAFELPPRKTYFCIKSILRNKHNNNGDNNYSNSNSGNWWRSRGENSSVEEIQQARRATFAAGRQFPSCRYAENLASNEVINFADAANRLRGDDGRFGRPDSLLIAKPGGDRRQLNCRRDEDR